MVEIKYDILEAALAYSKAGLSVIPVGPDKRPTIKWKPYQSQIMNESEIEKYFSNAYGVAIICGKVSGGLVCLDLDLKYDNTGELYYEFTSEMQKYLTYYYDSPLYEKTINDGYHFLYRTEDADGNIDLAKRPSTEIELAEKPKEKAKVLIETRGEGGYFVCYPTAGYTLRNGSFDSIPMLTRIQQKTLFSISRQFNQFVTANAPEPTKANLNGTLTSWQDFNNRGASILEMLEEHGYSCVRDIAKGTLIKRPGAETPYSGIIFQDSGGLYMHSTSTEFEPNKLYSPSNVFAKLYHSGDWKAAAKELYNKGYGNKSTNDAGVDMDKSLKEMSVCPPAIFHSAEDLLKKDITELPTLLGPIFPQKGLIALAGASDVGKSTWLRLFLIYLVAGRETYCGWKVKPRFHKALYYASEDASESIAYLLKKQCESLKIHSGQMEGLDFLFDYGETLVGTLEDYLKKKTVDCVVIDAFADVFSGELNKTNVVRSFLNKFSLLAERYDTLFIFLHHSGKKTEFGEPSKHNLIGSQGFESKMRLVVELREDYQDNSIRHLCIVKGNYLPKQYKNKSYVLTYSEDMLFTSTGERTPFEALVKPTESKGKKIDSAEVKQLKDEGLTHEQISKRLGCSEKTIQRALK